MGDTTGLSTSDANALCKPKDPATKVSFPYLINLSYQKMKDIRQNDWRKHFTLLFINYQQIIKYNFYLRIFFFNKQCIASKIPVFLCHFIRRYLE